MAQCNVSCVKSSNPMEFSSQATGCANDVRNASCSLNLERLKIMRKLCTDFAAFGSNLTRNAKIKCNVLLCWHRMNIEGSPFVLQGADALRRGEQLLDGHALFTRTRKIPNRQDCAVSHPGPQAGAWHVRSATRISRQRSGV